jgi:hypothetical protein
VVPVAPSTVPATLDSRSIAKRIQRGREHLAAWMERPGLGAALGYTALLGAGAALTVTHWSAMAAMDPLFNGLIAAWAVFMGGSFFGQRAVNAWAEVKKHPLRIRAAEDAVRNSAQRPLLESPCQSV